MPRAGGFQQTTRLCPEVPRALPTAKKTLRRASSKEVPPVPPQSHQIGSDSITLHHDLCRRTEKPELPGLVPARKMGGNMPFRGFCLQALPAVLPAHATPSPAATSISAEGTSPPTSAIPNNSPYGAGPSSQLGTAPAPPVSHGWPCGAARSHATEATPPGPKPPSSGYGPSHSSRGGAGMGRARKSAGSWPEARARIRQRLRLPFHSQWLLHQTHWWAEISAGL